MKKWLGQDHARTEIRQKIQKLSKVSVLHLQSCIFVLFQIFYYLLLFFFMYLNIKTKHAYTPHHPHKVSVEATFLKAAWLIANGPKTDEASTDQKLKVYALFKQAKFGDVTGSQPWQVCIGFLAHVHFQSDVYAILKQKSRCL